VQLVHSGDRLLARRLVAGNDTLRFDNVPYSVTSQADGIEMTGRQGSLTETVHVRPVAGHPYLLDVTGEFNGLEGRGALLVIGLGNGFANVEADSMGNYRDYAVSVRRSSPQNTTFRSVNEGVVQTLAGPFDWVGVKSKYFMGALLSADSTKPQFGGALLVGGPRENRLATTLQTWVTMPVGPDGRYHYQFYVGPQTFRTLRAMGRDMDRASSYGWIFKPIVMPAAAIITRLFMWMHSNLHLSYGMVLIVFGVMVRLVLWPLNQKAMKSQVAMMAIQPVLKDIQTRYKNDPQKLQQEMMKVYKEHNVNPLGGCLPLLIPMPVLLALFFVFNRALELRGTPFLWIPDLSLRDPLFITPIVMGLSMFGLSKLSQAGMPPNPQTKMMTTVMPVMMTFLFLNFASGLNLYYAVSNLVSLPQQYIINKSRAAEMARRQMSISKSG
jgi:YidC/Oxa1 family membrane protein insertase